FLSLAQSPLLLPPRNRPLRLRCPCSSLCPCAWTGESQSAAAVRVPAAGDGVNKPPLELPPAATAVEAVVASVRLAARANSVRLALPPAAAAVPSSQARARAGLFASASARDAPAPSSALAVLWRLRGLPDMCWIGGGPSSSSSSLCTSVSASSSSGLSSIPGVCRYCCCCCCSCSCWRYRLAVRTLAWAAAYTGSGVARAYLIGCSEGSWVWNCACGDGPMIQGPELRR